MTRRPIPDPFVYGPTPLLSEKDRPALDQLIASLESDLTREIRTRITAGADELFDRGYYAGELIVHGFGSEIQVHPSLDGKRSRFRLWIRRRLMSVHLMALPLRDYNSIECSDHDTERLKRGLKIFAPPERRRSHGPNE